VVEVRNPAPILLSGQDDNTTTLYGNMRFPNYTSISIGGGASYTTGIGNTFFGENAGLYTTSGQYNNFFGNQAGSNNTTGSDNNFFGNQAGRFNRIGSNNNFFGTSAGLSNSIGNSNNFFGFRTGESNIGNNNNFFGSQSGFRNTTASGNNFFGNQAGFNNTTGSDNNFFGNQAGRDNIAGNSNNFFGSLAGLSSVGNRNNFFGQSAGQVNRGDNNNFFGLNTGSINTTGSDNNFFGNQAGRSNTRGSNNNFIGSNTGYNTTAADTLTGSNNNVIGSESARNIASSAAGNLVLGSFVNLPTGNGSNQVVIKNLIFGTGASGTGTTIQTTAKAGINVNNPQSTLDVEGNMAIGATYSGTTAAPTNGLIVEGNTGIGTSSPQRRLHITGTVRVDTLTRDVPTRIVGADADGDLAALTLGTGLSIASGTLNGTDTTSLSNRINLKLNASDTTKYVKYADTSTTIATKANVALKLNISDTSVFARDWQIAGTINYLPKFTGASSIGNSPLYNVSDNKILIGATSTVSQFYNSLGVHSASNDNDSYKIPTLEVNAYNQYYPPNLIFRRSRASTVGGLTTVNSGDVLGTIGFYGADGAAFNPGALISALVDATSGIYDTPTALLFSTTGDGSYTATEKMRITNAGRVGIGTTSPSRTLHINSTDALKLPAGTTAERPSVGITGDLRMNTSPTVDSLEYYNGASWVTVQDKLQNPVTGTGTINYLPRFTGSGESIGNSNSYQTGDTLLTLMSPFYGLRLNGNSTPNSFTGWMPYSKMVLNVNGTSFAGIAMGDPTNSPVANQVAIQMTSWTGGGSNFYSTRLTNDNAGNFSIATSPVSRDADTVLTTRFSIMNDGKVGIGTTSPSRTLHVEGEARISDLTTDTPTRIVGADADGDLGAITLGTGLSISSGTLNASGITSVYIPINLFSPGDTVTNTTNAKNFFLVHSGLNGYCIDSYTVKAIAGTGTADIQVDKNDTGGNLQAISGTTVYTKDTNIALVTGDYIRGQVFNLSGTLVGLGLTLEIKATCN
jgi:hypothetical protein